MFQLNYIFGVTSSFAAHSVSTSHNEEENTANLSFHFYRSFR